MTTPISKQQKFNKSGQVTVNNSLCLLCGACVGACPANAMFLWNTFLEINKISCTLCGICVRICPVKALTIPEGRIEIN